MVTRVLVVVALLAVGALVMWLLVLAEPQPARRGGQPGRPEVTVFRAQQATVARQWRGFGTAQAMDAANVPARVTATVETVPEDIDIGRPVEQGQLLATLDASDFEREVEAAEQRIADLRAQLDQLDVQQRSLARQLELQEEDLELSRNDLERLRALQQRDAANQQEVDRTRREAITAERAVVSTTEALEQLPARRRQLQAQIDAQQAALAQARLNLQRTRITSPIAGVLEAVDIESGENLMVGARVARVVSLDRIEVPLQLPASARGGVEADDAVELRATDASGPTWTGQVARIAPGNQAETRTVTVYVELQQSHAAPTIAQRTGMLVPGMFVEGVVRSGESTPRWVVPRRAIRSGAIRTIDEEGRVVSQPVRVAWTFEGRVPEVGLPADRQWAVLAEGLDEGQLVMASASRSVLDGQPVDPVLAGQAQAAGRGDAP